LKLNKTLVSKTLIQS